MKQNITSPVGHHGDAKVILIRPVTPDPDRAKVIPADSVTPEPDRKGCGTFTIRNIMAQSSPEDAQRVPCLRHYDNEEHTPTVSPDDKSRSRILFSREQLTRLREVFQITQYPGLQERLNLARDLNMTHKSVKQWFQNARSKMKKRGTDHVTGFYANKMAAKRASLDASHSTTVKSTTSRHQSIGTNHVTAIKFADEADSAETSRVRVKASSPTGSKTNKVFCATSPSTQTSGDSSSDLDTSADSIRSSPIATKTLPGDDSFQQMQSVSLPADHPFCNLGNPEYVWPEMAQAPVETCDKEHESSETCEGRANDDVLAGYLKALRYHQTAVSKDANTKLHSSHSIKEIALSNKVRPEKRKRSTDSSCEHSSDEELPLDLSVKKRRGESPPRPSTQLKVCQDFLKMNAPVFHPMALMHPYFTFPSFPSGFLPLNFVQGQYNK